MCLTVYDAFGVLAFYELYMLDTHTETNWAHNMDKIRAANNFRFLTDDANDFWILLCFPWIVKISNND